MSNYNDKIILITGASSGMGKVTARFLADKGVKAVTLFARRKEELEEVAKDIESKTSTKALVVAGDTSNADDVKRAVDETVSTFGGITSAFINAGVYRGGAKLEEVKDEDIDAILDINVKGVLYCLRYVLPAIGETVGAEGPTGSIVINSSTMGVAVIGPKSAGSGVYSASKAFVNSLVETAAIEYAPRIRVNGVLPGIVKTSIFPLDDETYNTVGANMQPLYGRPGKSEEIASLVAYLVSDEASFISGSNIKADGLWSLSGGSLG
mmetsp:Transcript_21775/g.37063  ORF Transcript_21775/g.37063 Transcript_21775/m.37063 type:complete len:266 (-) Transcript_21775:64-861(-)